MDYISHIVFALKDSRYEIERIKRKKLYGYIAPTFPFFESQEEDLLIEELCKAASAVGISVVAMNFCGDHLHAIIKSKSNNLSQEIGRWKGKTAYEYNRRINPSINQQNTIKSDGTKQSLWAKGYYQKYLNFEDEFLAAANYIRNNRIKHHLPPLSSKSLAFINELIQKT